MQKILIVSHNVLSPTSAMGKTLLSYFAGWDGLAQFYIHSEVPTHTLCRSYYRVTDKDILKSILTRSSGTVLTAQDIRPDRVSARTDTGMTAKIYQRSRARTPLIYFLRNTIWFLGRWRTKKLRRWLDEVQPDAVFFASGDYAFMYKIALRIAKERSIPLYVSCMDDYYFYNKNGGSLFGRWVQKRFMKQVHKTMDYAAGLFPICEKMTEDYRRLFSKPCVTLHTAASFDGPLQADRKTNRIAYLGNLGYRRDEQLVALGRALKRCKSANKPDAIDVYSSESRPEILRHMTEENGIRFHGSIDAAQVRQVMAESMLLIHTESFDASIQNSIAYSVSTKIADSLASGTCLLAYGPSKLASIEYLQSNRAAWCITDEAPLVEGLEKILSDEALRQALIGNALALAKKNHSPSAASQTLLQNMK